jgi:hypothetical protein
MLAARLVPAFYHIYIRGHGLLYAIEFAIPALAVFSGLKDHLSIAVIDPKIDQVYACTNRADNVISTIAIWRKTRGYIDFRAAQFSNIDAGFCVAATVYS